MRRILGSVPLYVLLFAGCADHDDDGGFTTPATEPGSTTASPMSTSESSTDSGTSTGLTDGVSGSTGSVPTSSGTTDESSTGGADASTGTSTTGSSTTGTSATDATTDAETGTTTGTTGEDTAGAHSFLVDIWPLFDDHCSCHKDANGAGKLRLAMEDAYTNIVDKPSLQAPMMMLVAPGSAEQSYLWHKLNDTQDDVGGKGKKMPPGGKLKAAELELIAQWIDEGAQP